MSFKLNQKCEYKQVFTVLTVLSLIFGAACVFIELFAVPFFAAFVAALFTVSFPKRHGAVTLALVCSSVCAISFFFGALPFFSALVASVLGLIIGVAFTYKRSKPEAVVFASAGVIAVTLLALWLFAAKRIGSFDFAAVKDFYLSFLFEIKNYILNSFSEMMAKDPAFQQLSLADLELYLNAYAYLLPSVLVIFALTVSGFAFKLFGIIVYKYSYDRSYILTWRFITSNVFVVFYIVLAVANSFLTDLDVLSISVANLYSIFNFVFAYIGFNFITAIFAQRMRPAFARIFVLGVTLLLSSVAIQLLAILGAVFSFLTNKAGGFIKTPGSNTDSSKSNDESENDDEK